MDGNKRVSVFMTVAMLRANGYFLDVEPLEAHKLVTETMEKNGFRFPMIRDWIGSFAKPLDAESHKGQGCGCHCEHSGSFFLPRYYPRQGKSRSLPGFDEGFRSLSLPRTRHLLVWEAKLQGIATRWQAIQLINGGRSVVIVFVPAGPGMSIFTSAG